MEIFLLIVITLILVIEVMNSKKIQQLEKKPEVKLNEQEKRKMEAIKTSFNNLMEYDEQTAMKRK
jgi:uncharacterized membrane protein